MTLRLTGAAAVVGPPGRRPVIDTDMLRYHRDLHIPFGVQVEEELLSVGRYVTHADLVELLLRELAPGVSRPDLVLLSYGLPDVHPFKAVASHLNFLLGGGAQSFAISEQGLGAPFTALGVAAAYEYTGAINSSVLAVLEQTTLPARDPVAHCVTVDSGVLLTLGRGHGPLLVAAQRLTDSTQLTAMVSALKLTSRPLIVCGPWAGGMSRLVPDAVYYQVPAGTFCTSVWLALAKYVRTWERQFDTIFLLDTDPRSGDNFMAVLSNEERV